MMLMTHWDLLFCLALGAVLGGVKGRHEKTELLSARNRVGLFMLLVVVLGGLSGLKFQPAGWDAWVEILLNMGVGLAALWFAFSWSRWFFGPIRWN